VPGCRPMVVPPHFCRISLLRSVSLAACWSVFLPRANSMFFAGGPPPSDRAGDDTIEYVPNESSSVEHLCRAGRCAGGDSRPLPVPLRPPPRSNILDIRSIVSFVGVAELHSCRLAGTKLRGAGLIGFLTSAGTERLPDSLMADSQWSRVRRLSLFPSSRCKGATRPVVGLYQFRHQRNNPLPQRELRNKWVGFWGSPRCTPVCIGEQSVGGPGGPCPCCGGAR
jgi:hypothetical protein